MADLSGLDGWRASEVAAYLRKEAEAGNTSPILEKYEYMITDKRLDGRTIVEMTSRDFDRLRDELREEGLSKYSASKIVEALRDMQERSIEDERRRVRVEEKRFEEDRLDRLSQRSIRSSRYAPSVTSSILKRRSVDDWLEADRSVYRDHRDRSSVESLPSGASIRSKEIGWGLGRPNSSREDQTVKELRTNVGDWERAVQRMGKENLDHNRKLDRSLREISRCCRDYADQQRTHREYKKIAENLKDELELPLEDIFTDLKEGKKTLDKIGKVKRKKSSTLLKLFIGDISVRGYHEGELIRLKDSYLFFLSKFVVGFFAFPIGMMISGFSAQINCLLQVFLVIFFGCTAIRMSILHLHGAEIKSSWIHQNYIALVGAIVSIFTPVSSPLATFGFIPYGVSLFYLGQGAVVLMQHAYLSKKLQADLLPEKWSTKSGEGDLPVIKRLHPPTILIALLWTGAFIELLFSIVMAYVSTLGSALSLLQGLLMSITWLLRGLHNIVTLAQAQLDQRSKKTKKKKKAKSGTPSDPISAKKND